MKFIREHSSWIQTTGAGTLLILKANNRLFTVWLYFTSTESGRVSDKLKIAVELFEKSHILGREMGIRIVVPKINP